MGCTIEEAQAFADAYAEGFKGIAKFKEIGSKKVKELGYITLCEITGHKTFWWDHDRWLAVQESFTPEFWDRYKPIKEKKLKAINEKKQYDYYLDFEEKKIIDSVSTHFKAAAKWCRKALNSVTQGEGAVILKDSQIRVFNWVVDNGYFNKILLCNLTHDEANWEYPKEVENFPKILQQYMEEAAAFYCKSLPIPAEPEISNHWVH